ncbi:hypothetical protein N9033_00590 [bacterium]|nr:hypothetical protein [bacterium]
MVRIEDNVRIVNALDRYVRAKPEILSKDDQEHINNRIEGVVDAAVYRYTGRKVFEDSYREVESPVEDATMVDLNLDNIDIDREESPVMKIMPKDFKIKSKKTDTSLLDKLKIPTLSIPMLPTAALAFGKSVLGTGSLLSLGALMLEAFAALKDIKDFKTTRSKGKPTGNKTPKRKPPSKFKNWLRNLKNKPVVLKLVNILRNMFNNRFTKPMIEWITNLSNDVAAIARSIVSAYNTSVSWIKGKYRTFAASLDKMLSLLKSSFTDLYVQMIRRIRLAAAATLKATNKIASWIGDSKLLRQTGALRDVVNRWMRGIKFPPGVKYIDKIKHLRKLVKGIPYVGALLEYGFTTLDFIDMEDSQEYKVDSKTGEMLLGRNAATDRMVEERRFSSEKGILGNAMTALNTTSPTSILVMDNLMAQSRDFAQHTRNENIKQRQALMQGTYARYWKELADDSNWEEQAFRSLEYMVKNGELSEERMKELKSDPAIKRLAIEIAKYNSGLLAQRSLYQSLYENYHFSNFYGYQSKAVRLFGLREGGDEKYPHADEDQKRYMDRMEKLSKTPMLDLTYFLADAEHKDEIKEKMFTYIATTESDFPQLPGLEPKYLQNMIGTTPVQELQLANMSDYSYNSFGVKMDAFASLDLRQGMMTGLEDIQSEHNMTEQEKKQDTHDSLILKKGYDTQAAYEQTFATIVTERNKLARANKKSRDEYIKQQQDLMQQTSTNETLQVSDPLNVDTGIKLIPANAPVLSPDQSTALTSGSYTGTLQAEDGPVSLSMMIPKNTKTQDIAKLQQIVKAAIKGQKMTREQMIKTIREINQQRMMDQSLRSGPTLYVSEGFEIPSANLNDK